VDELAKKKIAEAVMTAPNEPELAKYLNDVALKLSRKGFAAGTLTAREGVIALTREEKPALNLRLFGDEFHAMNRFFGLTPGLHIVAAPSGHGKTLWAMEWAKSAAKSGFQVLFVSLEMTPVDLSARLIAEITELPLDLIMTRSWTDTQKQIVESLFGEDRFAWMDALHIDNLGDYDWSKIFPRLWERMSKIRPRLVIIDYAQMLHDSEEKDPRMSKLLGDVARDLKLFADNSNAAVLLLSQINRQGFREIKESTGNENFIPLSNEFIKESSGIVDAADSVQLVCMTNRLPQCPPKLEGFFQVTVDKSRRLGKLGVVLLPFDFKRMKFISKLRERVQANGK
jgi:replicative DNA helicase